MKCEENSSKCNGEIINFIEVMQDKVTQIEHDFCVWHANERWGFTQENLDGLKR